MSIIAVTHNKGGVGKTTVTFYLAQPIAAALGNKVLAVDTNP
jgi:cellulose biosynthesis protein BcsQ